MGKFSTVDTNILLDLIYKYKSIIESNDSNRSGTQADNTLAWKIITKEFNSKVGPNNQASNIDLQLKYFKLKTQINPDEDGNKMPTSVRDRLISILSKPDEKNDGVNDVPTTSKEPTTVLGEPKATAPTIVKPSQNPGEPEANNNPKNIKRPQESDGRNVPYKVRRIQCDDRANRLNHAQVLNDYRLKCSKLDLARKENELRSNEKIDELRIQVLQMDIKVKQIELELKRAELQSWKDGDE